MEVFLFLCSAHTLNGNKRRKEKVKRKKEKDTTYSFRDAL